MPAAVDSTHPCIHPSSSFILVRVVGRGGGLELTPAGIRQEAGHGQKKKKKRSSRSKVSKKQNLHPQRKVFGFQ